MPRKRKSTTNSDNNEKNIFNKLWDKLSRDDMIYLLKQYREGELKKPKKKRMRDASKYKFSIADKAWFFNLSRSGIYKNYYVTYKNHRNPLWEQIITDAFNDNYKIYGRRRLAIYIFKKYKICISPRTVGNYMKALNLQCITRKPKRSKENKNTRVKFNDLVKRDYQNQKVNATDGTFIRIQSSKFKHAYLSIVINHHNKLILNWKLSKRNDVNLVYNTLSSIKTDKDTIIHSDHGVQYSSDKLFRLANRKKYKISMSRIGNCLDNREAEYFFSNIKSECLNHYPTHKMTFAEVKKIIAKYIEWYNNERIQKRLGWKSPAQFKSQEWFIPKTVNSALNQDYIAN